MFAARAACSPLQCCAVLVSNPRGAKLPTRASQKTVRSRTCAMLQVGILKRTLWNGERAAAEGLGRRDCAPPTDLRQYTIKRDQAPRAPPPDTPDSPSVVCHAHPRTARARRIHWGATRAGLCVPLRVWPPTPPRLLPMASAWSRALCPLSWPLWPSRAVVDCVVAARARRDRELRNSMLDVVCRRAAGDRAAHCLPAPRHDLPLAPALENP